MWRSRPFGGGVLNPPLRGLVVRDELPRVVA
jgi:hypothetical protein